MRDYSELDNTVFIGEFDENKHQIRDYKLIIVLNDIEIDGVSHDGECLFIPYLKEERESVGIIKPYFEHRRYLKQALKKYNFGIMDNAVKEIIEMLDTGRKVMAEDIVNVLMQYGNAVLYDVSLDDDKQMVLFIPSEMSENVEKTLAKFREELPKQGYVYGLGNVNRLENKIR